MDLEMKDKWLAGFFLCYKNVYSRLAYRSHKFTTITSQPITTITTYYGRKHGLLETQSNRKIRKIDNWRVFVDDLLFCIELMMSIA